MGNNSTQALGALSFLAAFVAIGAGFFSGGNLLLFILGLALLGLSVAVFQKAKPWEHQD